MKEKEFSFEFQKRLHKLLTTIEPLGNGENPPSHLINPEYKEQPKNPRKCEKCGKIHDMIVENTMTGERIEELIKCKDCLFKSFKFEWHGDIRCMTSNGKNVNVADELNRIEKEKIDG